jgi:hypothetical protein
MRKELTSMWNKLGRSYLLMLVLAVATVSVARAHVAATTLPSNLTVPDHNVLLFKTSATGVQLYACKPRADDPNAYVWTFLAPSADLLNDAGEKVGTHGAGPFWASDDGSQVVGKVLERADAPDASAIPWLLLEVTSHEGTGVFSDITYIQRVDTVGGIAPADGCDASTANAERAVPYTATYVYYHHFSAHW